MVDNVYIEATKCSVSREGHTQAFMVVQPEFIPGNEMTLSSGTRRGNKKVTGKQKEK